MPDGGRVLVVGAGPAGGVAAVLLARAGVRVRLLHRPAGAEPRIGEVLPGAARPTLERLGLAGILDDSIHAPSPGAVTAWGTARPRETDALFSPYGSGHTLDRVRFDASLLEMAAAAG